MNWIQNFVKKLFRIQPAREREVVIIEPHTFLANVIRNKLWYRGDSAELEQYFKKTARWDVEKARFWAATAQGSVRKMHSGIVSTVVDRYKDIVLADMDAVDFGEGQLETEETWKEIFDGADLNNVIGEGISGALASGDGAFKITADECSPYPIIEFYDAENVNYVYSHSRLKEIKFYTSYKSGSKELWLEETYGYGYIKYRLYDDYGREVSLKQLPETAHLMDIGIEGDLLLAVPLKIFSSIKYKHRGKALFDGKTDVLDGLDEVISQWMDAIRMGRIKRYIPENLIPRDPVDGKMLPANPFDNDFIAIGDNMAEKSNQQVEISQPQISYEAYVSSYASFLDMVLQGIISPSTLGIDLKKTDNAESQREKEKVTLHVRNKIVDALNETLPELIQVVLQCYDLMCGKAPGEYEPTVKFGEYASPDFGTTVETVGKAKQYGVMSLETSVDQLYGDTWTQEEKDAEVERLKTEQGIAELEEPGINQSAGSFQLNTEGGKIDGGDNREKGLGGESGTVQEPFSSGK
jgi:hypothetical protein